MWNGGPAVMTASLSAVATVLRDRASCAGSNASDLLSAVSSDA